MSFRISLCSVSLYLLWHFSLCSLHLCLSLSCCLLCIPWQVLACCAAKWRIPAGCSHLTVSHISCYGNVHSMYRFIISSKVQSALSLSEYWTFPLLGQYTQFLSCKRGDTLWKPACTQIKKHINWLPVILLFERMLRKPFTVMRGDYFKSITAGSVNEYKWEEREIQGQEKGRERR